MKKTRWGVPLFSWCVCSKVGCVSAHVCVSSTVSVCLLRFARDAPVCTFKNHPCVPSKNVSVSQDTGVLTAHMDAKAFSVVFSVKTKKHTRIEKSERRARHLR